MHVTLKARAVVSAAILVVVNVTAFAQELSKSNVDQSDADKRESAKTLARTRAELIEKQTDVTLEARDIERILGKLKRASDLSKHRMTEAAKCAETVSTSLDKGDATTARADACLTSEMFREIIKQLEVLLKEETPQQIAEARKLTEELARMERQFVEQIGSAPDLLGQPNPPVATDAKAPPTQQNDGPPAKAVAQGTSPSLAGKPSSSQISTPKTAQGAGGSDLPQNNKSRMSAQQLREAMVQRANQLAEMGRTLQDVLQTIGQSTDPADKEAVAKVQEVIKESNLDKLVGQIVQIADLVRAKKDTDAKLAGLDAAERLEIMARQLDAAYRAIVAPKVEELRKLEQMLADLREKLTQLETPAQVAAWHREARNQLERLEKAGVTTEARQLLEKQMKDAGFAPEGPNNTAKWTIQNNLYVGPTDYNLALGIIQDELQQRIQQLILGDLTSVGDEATPPQYQELVDRYFQVLTRGSNPAGPRPKRENRNPSK